ncbi:uncharacterized protein [Physcomitrium patens]|uniref:Fungal lipase-type domain-containing protein n=1 Tax=Physcomitrium patens TaxID=3218 RepID=A9RQE6_PHYPA|nr:uncharacterized protein LOC112278608 [Physcomitrium patens]PNR26053.1 hypothetical protein PHYPA_031179 [Physcomitrium patens]|eukprot:XP_024367975.1 uncharacterized protein LOC112278608 [Physcomitrella patens]
MITLKIYKHLKECDRKKKKAQSIKNWVKEQQAVATPKRTIPPEVASYIRNANLQQVLAMLVDGVYSRDEEATSLQYLLKHFVEAEYEADVRTELYTAIYWTRMDELASNLEDEAMVGIRHYLRKDIHPNAAAPRLVIALRGTKTSNARDIRDNVRVLLNSLHQSIRYKKCQEIVLDLVTKFQGHPYNGKPHEIYITGHSLGGAIALLIAKDLASMNPPHRLETHLFNPPFIRLPEGVQAGAQELIQMRESYKKLADWVPKLYINKDDLLCMRFHKYYSKKQTNVPNLPVRALMRILGRNDKYITLMPSVDMYISDYKDPSVSLAAHKLKQWYAIETVRVETTSYRLLPKTPPAAEQYPPLYVQDAQQQPQPQTQPSSGFNPLENAGYCNPIPYAQPQFYPPYQAGFNQYGSAAYPNQAPYIHPQYPPQHIFNYNAWAKVPVYGYPYPAAQPQYQSRSLDPGSIDGAQLHNQPHIQSRSLNLSSTDGAELGAQLEMQFQALEALAQTYGFTDQRGLSELTVDQLHFGYEYSSDEEEEEDELIPPPPQAELQ